MTSFLKQNWKKYGLGVLIGLLAFPAVSLGGTFVVSLIQGKSVDEAVQILAKQIDTLIGRVEVIEDKQAEQDKTLNTQQQLIQQQQDIINQLDQGESKRKAGIQEQIDKLNIQIKEETSRKNQCFEGTAYTAPGSDGATSSDPNNCLRYQRTIDVLLPQIKKLEEQL